MEREDGTPGLWPFLLSQIPAQPKKRATHFRPGRMFRSRIYLNEERSVFRAIYPKNKWGIGIGPSTTNLLSGRARILSPNRRNYRQFIKITAHKPYSKTTPVFRCFARIRNRNEAELVTFCRYQAWE